METQQSGEGVQLAEGTIVSGRYEVRDLLGVGGFARVYSAFDKVIERDVALKVLDLVAIGASEDQLKTLMVRFEREAKLAARIDHPCVVQIHDIGRLEDDQHSPYIVMEMLSGLDLEAYLRDHGTLPPDRLWELFAEALEALGEAHKAGIIHRDLKPSNLFLHMPGTRRERLRIVDFGIAAMKIKEGANSNEEMERLTRTGQLFGTLQYMAPEYIGKQQVSPALDVYQMALILVELLSGERVVLAETPMDCLRLHTFRQMTLPEYLLRSPLRALLKQALDPDPAYRFADAHAFAEAMHKVDPTSIPPRRGARRLQFLDDQDLSIEEQSEPDGFEDTAVAGGDSLSSAYTMEHGSSPISLAAQDSEGEDGFADTAVSQVPGRAQRLNTGPYAGPTTGAGIEAPGEADGADRTFEERDSDRTFEDGGDEDAFADTMIAARPKGLLPALGSPGGRINPLPKLGGRTPLLRPGQKAIPSLDDLDGEATGSSTAESDRPADALPVARDGGHKLRPLVSPGAKVATPGHAPQFEPESGPLDDGPTVRDMTFPPAADAARSGVQQPPEGASSPSIRLLREPLIETVRQHETPAPQRATQPSQPLTERASGPQPVVTPPSPQPPITAPTTAPIAQPARSGLPMTVAIVGGVIILLLVIAVAYLAGQRSRPADPAPSAPAERSEAPAAPVAKVEPAPQAPAPSAAPALKVTRVDSIPQGADVLRGAELLGKTPLDYTFRDGERVAKVRVKLTGHVEQEATLDAARSAPVILSLTPLDQGSTPLPAPAELAQDRSGAAPP